MRVLVIGAPRALGEFSQLSVGIAPDNAAATVNHGSFGLEQHVAGLLDLLMVADQSRFIGAHLDLFRIVKGRPWRRRRGPP